MTKRRSDHIVDRAPETGALTSMYQGDRQPSGVIATVTPNAAVDRISVIEDGSSWPDLRALQTEVAPGGSGIHAARVAQALGSVVRVHGFAGGHEGRQLVELLEKEGIAHTLTAVDSATRVNTVVLSKSEELLVELSEPGPAVSPAEERLLLQTVTEQLGDARVLVLSGSLPPGGSFTLYADLAAIGRDHGVSVLVDAAGPSLVGACVSQPVLAKCNHRELQVTLGFPDLNPGDTAGVADALRCLVTRGSMWACMTRGALGAVLVGPEGDFAISVPDLGGQQVSGSGDAALGAIATALSQGAEMPDAVRLGVAAGSVNTITRGVGVVSSAEVHDVSADVTIDRLPRRKGCL